MNKRWLVAAAACCMSAPVFAGSYGHGGDGVPMSYLDGYYMPSTHIKYEFPGPGHASEDGDGYGVKGAVNIGGGNVFLTGEYQKDNYDHTRFALDQFRAGVAIGPGASPKGGLFGRVEYVNIDGRHDGGEDTQDGIAGHIGFSFPLTNAFRLYAEGGYVRLDDIDGPEFAAGGDYQFTPNLGVFADYRYSDFEDRHDDDYKFKPSDFRVGLRFYF